MIQDSMMVVDSAAVQAVADSAAAGIVATIAAFVSAKLALGLGIGMRFVVEYAKKAMWFWDGLSPMKKAGVALLWAQGAVFANMGLAAIGAPSFPASPDGLVNFVMGFMVWGMMMGTNWVWDKLFKKEA